MVFDKVNMHYWDKIGEKYSPGPWIILFQSSSGALMLSDLKLNIQGMKIMLFSRRHR